MVRTEAFGILGVSAEAGADEISSAYRRLAMTHHPDRGGDPAKFHEITTARDVALEYVKTKKPEGCSTCSGTGKVKKMRGFTIMTMSCVECGGTGKARGKK